MCKNICHGRAASPCIKCNELEKKGIELRCKLAEEDFLLVNDFRKTPPPNNCVHLDEQIRANSSKK